MRIKITNPKKFFEEVLTKLNLNLKQFSEKSELEYSTLKKYRRGDLLIPEGVFERLLALNDHKEHWRHNSQRLDDNWGNSKGGLNASINDKQNKRLEYARKCRKKWCEEFKLDLSNEFFCEFYGALLGDGCISRFKTKNEKKRIIISISGNKKLDSEYLKYLKEKLDSELNIHSYLYAYPKRNLIVLMICKKSFALALKKIGFPFGKKYGKLCLSPEMINAPWKVQKMIIRGYFDTDGSIYAKKNENYKYPHICLSSKDKVLLKQFYDILKQQKYPCWIGGDNLVIRGNANTIRWFKDIGSSNNRNVFKYHYWIKNRTMPKNLGS